MQHIMVNEGLTSGAKLRGKWRPTKERRAELEARRDRLDRRKRQIEARLTALDPRDKLAARKRETRANIVLGAVLRAHMDHNPSFAAELAHILEHNLRRPADRQLLAGVLGMSQLVAPAASPASSTLRGKRLGHLAPEITARASQDGSGHHC